MRERVSTAIGLILAIVLVCALAYAIVRGVEKDPSVVGAFVTAGGALVAVVWGRQREKRLELLQSHRESMAPIYEELFKAFVTAAEGKSLDSFFAEFQRKLVLYGPTSVLTKWLDFVRSEISEGELDPAALLRWEAVLFAIRDDLGHDNRGLAPGDLIRVYVPDSDAFFGTRRAVTPAAK